MNSKTLFRHLLTGAFVVLGWMFPLTTRADCPIPAFHTITAHNDYGYEYCEDTYYWYYYPEWGWELETCWECGPCYWVNTGWYSESLIQIPETTASFNYQITVSFSGGGQSSWSVQSDGGTISQSISYDNGIGYITNIDVQQQECSFDGDPVGWSNDQYTQYIAWYWPQIASTPYDFMAFDVLEAPPAPPIEVPPQLQPLIESITIEETGGALRLMRAPVWVLVGLQILLTSGDQRVNPELKLMHLGYQKDPDGKFKFNWDTSGLVTACTASRDPAVVASQRVIQLLEAAPIFRFYVCATAETEFNVGLNSGYAGDFERLLGIIRLAGASHIPDSPSPQFSALPDSLGVNDKIIFGTGDSIGASTISADITFVKKASAKGILFKPPPLIVANSSFVGQ